MTHLRCYAVHAVLCYALQCGFIRCYALLCIMLFPFLSTSIPCFFSLFDLLFFASSAEQAQLSLHREAPFHKTFEQVQRIYT